MNDRDMIKLLLEVTKPFADGVFTPDVQTFPGERHVTTQNIILPHYLALKDARDKVEREFRRSGKK